MTKEQSSLIILASQSSLEHPVEGQNDNLLTLNQPGPAKEQSSIIDLANQSSREHPVEVQNDNLLPSKQTGPTNEQGSIILQVNQSGLEHPLEGQNVTIPPVNQTASHPVRGEEEVILPPCHKQSKLHKKSYIDDLTLLEKINLKRLK